MKNKDLEDWLNTHPVWFQEAACRILNGKELDEEDYAELMTMLKDPPEHLPKGRPYPELRGTRGSGKSLRIESLGAVHGIDALNPKTPVSFEDVNLSVVFGENGTGKSGYARILKKASGRGEKVALQSNVFEESPGRRSCLIRFSQDGVMEEVEWGAEDDPLEALAALEVFDRQAGKVLLDKGSELVFLPPELDLLDRLGEVSRNMTTRIEAEEGQIVSRLPLLPREFEDTSAGGKYNKLRSNSKVSVLTAWSETDEEKLKQTDELLSSSDPAADLRRIQRTRREAQKVTDRITEALDVASSNPWAAIKEATKEVEKSDQAAQQGGTVLGEASVVDGVGSETWKALWEAACAYAEDQHGESFPSELEGARCVLCQQSIGDEAKQRLGTFAEFVEGRLAAEVNTAKAKLNASLDQLPTCPSAEEIATSVSAAGLADEEIEELQRIWKTISEAVTKAQASPENAGSPELTDATLLIQKLKAHVAGLDERASGLQDRESGEVDSTGLQAELLELQARKWISAQADALAEEVAYLQKMKVFKAWKKDAKRHTAVSRKSGELSETLITNAFVSRFNEELRLLGAAHIHVKLEKTRTSKGRPWHGIRFVDSLDPRQKVGGVLSDGEHRVVAMAAFLADVRQISSRLPILFDEPFTDLGLQFEVKTVERLAALADERQVLVFTHRKQRAKELIEVCSGSSRAIELKRESWGTGEPHTQ